jgi:hypothetical protein
VCKENNGRDRSINSGREVLEQVKIIEQIDRQFTIQSIINKDEVIEIANEIVIKIIIILINK